MYIIKIKSSHQTYNILETKIYSLNIWVKIKTLFEGQQWVELP